MGEGRVRPGYGVVYGLGMGDWGTAPGGNFWGEAEDMEASEVGICGGMYNGSS